MTAWVARRVDPSRLTSIAATAVLVGLLAGVVAALFATVAGEPAIEDAIAIEEASAAADAAGGPAGDAARGPAGDAHGEEASVSRADQRGVGLFGAYALTGGAYGLVLALTAHAFRRQRPDPVGRALLSGAVLAGAFTVAPWLKYPPNPPAVGDPDTLAQRQALYVLVICLAAGLGVAAALTSTRLRRQGWPEHRRLVAVAALVAVPLLAVFALLPGAPDEITVPAALLWRFRVASLGTNLTLWAVLTFGVAWALGEARDGRRSPAGPERSTAAG